VYKSGVGWLKKDLIGIKIGLIEAFFHRICKVVDGIATLATSKQAKKFNYLKQ
jgi:hypothetical protein